MKRHHLQVMLATLMVSAIKTNLPIDTGRISALWADFGRGATAKRDPLRGAANSISGRPHAHNRERSRRRRQWAAVAARRAA